MSLAARSSVLVAVTAASMGLGAWLLGTLGFASLGVAMGGLMGVGYALWARAQTRDRVADWLRRGAEGDPPDVEPSFRALAVALQKSLQERKRAVAAEAQRMAEFLEAINASPNGVLMLDEQDRIQFLNATAALHLHLHPQRDIGQHLTNLVRQPAVVDALTDEDRSQSQELTVAAADRQLQVLFKPYGPGLRLMLTQDVTEREEAERMRRDFVAHVSHEIRTPLTVTSGFLESLETLTLTEPERLRVIELMKQQTQRMQSLVDDLLALAKLEGRPRPGTDQWFSLADLLERVDAEGRALSAGLHHIELRPVSRQLEVAGEASELHSAVANLLQNAVRYTPQGGTITTDVAVDDAGAVLVHVTDNGLGILREHLPRLTQRFYRVDSSRSRDTGGTGLGLAIVKHAIQRHGGELLIASEVGKGSTFTLRIPAVRVRTGGANISAPAARPPERLSA